MEKMPIKKIKIADKTILVDGDYDGEYFSQYNWRILPNGYVYRSEAEKLANGKWKHHIIYLHREVARPPKGMWVSHIDGNKLNNRSCNLAWRTPHETALSRPASVRKREMRKEPALTAKRAQGRPMANSGGLKRHAKKLRKQIKTILRSFK